MEIRSVTFFANPKLSLDPVAAAAADARTMLGEANLAYQTMRLATTPFPDWYEDPVQVAELVNWCAQANVDYIALGPVRLIDDPAMLAHVPALIAAHDNVFASAQVADTAGRIDTGRALALAELVRQLSTVRPDGFANLYFTVTAACPPGSPFFPVSYHGGGPARFAIACEAADMAVTALRAASSLAEARANLVAAIEAVAVELTDFAEHLSRRHEVAFCGLDFSLAPYPETMRSLGTAMEALGVPVVGAHGSLFAAAFLAEAVRRATFLRCGFSGLMFPVLEDATLAQRVSENKLGLNDLLLYSAVCGAGLDTIPLPGDVSEHQLAAILLDMAALATRLDKPLTARLMPLPGLQAGDPVHFDFNYFSDSSVMAVREGINPAGLLGQGERITIRPRRPR